MQLNVKPAVNGVTDFDEMIFQLRDTLAYLQDSVNSRTRDLEIAAEVSKQVVRVLDLNELLPQVSKITRDSFDLYHVHIYLFDDEQKLLTLAGGAGEIGVKMVSEHRTIALDKETSLVAIAARDHEPVVSNDVREDANFLPHPLLPETRSELAIPMIVADELVGILDVQANVPDRFTEHEVRLMSTLAGQIAIAVRNARLYAQRLDAEKRLAELATQLETVAEVSAAASTALNLDTLLRRVCDLTKVNFHLYHVHIYLIDANHELLVLEAGAGEVGTQMVSERRSIPLTKEESLVATAARDGKIVVSNNVRADANFLPHPLLPDTRAEMAIPLFVEDELVGVLDVQAAEVERFDDVDQRVMSTLAAQVAVAIRNAHLYEERLRAEQRLEDRAKLLETVSEVSAAAATVLDLDMLLMSICHLTKFNFDLYLTQIYLLNKETDTLVLEAGSDIVGETMTSEGRPIPLDHEHSLVASAARSGEVIISNDVTQDPHFLPHPLLLDTHAEMVLPLYVENELVGVLDVQSKETNRFDEEDTRVMSTLAAQVAVAVRNARLYTERKEAEERLKVRAGQLETVAQVSAAATTVLDVDTLLKSVSDLSKEQFGLYHAHIYLFEEEGEQLVLHAGAGDTGDRMVSEGRSIPLGNENSLVATAARDRKAVISNDVMEDPHFLAHPLLQDTRSEMAVPLIVGDYMVGVLDVQAEEINRFDEENVLVLTTLASQVAVAVQNARAYQYQIEVAEELRELDRLKSEFLANMSHELRTPLNSIIGYSEVLLDGIDGDLSDEAHLDVEDIYHSGKHLLAIINDILDLAKIEAGQMKIEPKHMDAAKVARDVIHSSSVLMKDKPVEMIIDGDGELPVNADPVRLRQIILNLVSNAVKFTEEGSVTCEYGYHDDDNVYIKVIDTGIGMTPEGLQMIFERFSQVDGSVTRRSGGTGLGLTITRELVHMHGGEIYVESEEGAGSTFWFTLPVDRERAKE